MRVVVSKTHLAFFFLLFVGVAALLVFADSRSSQSGATVSQSATYISQARQRGVPPKYAAAYVKEAEKRNIDWALLAAIGWAESRHGQDRLPGVRKGLNIAGCCSGPLQICVVDSCGRVAEDYGTDGNGDGKVDIFLPEDAIATAALYLRWVRSAVGSNPVLMAAAYNAGPTIVAQIRAVPDYPETRDYVRKVMLYRQRLLQKKV